MLIFRGPEFGPQNPYQAELQSRSDTHVWPFPILPDPTLTAPVFQQAEADYTVPRLDRLEVTYKVVDLSWILKAAGNRIRNKN